MNINMIRLAIVDSDRLYLSRITQALQSYQEFEIAAFTTIETFREASDKSHFDVILFAPALYDPCMTERNMIAIAMITDQSELSGLGGVPYVDKYQKASRFYQEILSRFSEHHAGMASDGAARLIAVYSPVGGAGKTTVALLCATRMAGEGKRTLYVNFENIASCEYYLPQDQSIKGISEIAASIGEQIDFGMKIRSLLQTRKENLYYLNHFDSPNDLLAMSDKDVEELLHILAFSGLFDVIVLDMGSTLVPLNIKLFSLADIILLIARPGESAIEKINKFLAQTYILNDISYKMRLVINFDTNHTIPISAQIPVIGKIGTYQNPDGEQLIAGLARSASLSFLGNSLLE